MFDNLDVMQLLSDHWPFLVVSLLLAVVGEVLKRIILPRDRKSATGWRWWFYITLPLHPLGAGGLIGLLPFMPCPVAICPTTTHRVLYYAAAGVLSSYVYAAGKHLYKKYVGEDAPRLSAG